MKRKILITLFSLLGAYIIYIGIGMYLTATNKIDEWVVFPNTVIARGDHDADYSVADNDGPHIFYRGDSIYVKAVIKQDTTAVAVINNFPSSFRDSVVVNCAFSKHPEWNFTTHLKDTLIIEQVTYPQPDSLLAISDIEGNFEAFRNLLIGNNVMDDNYKWKFGTGHLALVGDFFDRGLYVTETLWLIYHLEQQAQEAGGKVHFILGNHDIMNMQNDLRYVRNKYIENTYLIHENYKKWYKQETELGRWLQTKNVVEKVGNMLLVHGGISEELNERNLSLEEINSICRQHYFTDDSLLDATATGKVKLLYSSDSSPLWYRGYVKDDASQKQVDNTLKKYDASAIVVGHTVVDNVQTLYNGKVIAIDTRHSKGNSQALFCKDNTCYKTDISGKRVRL